jgi:hypothetical protein
LTTLRGRCLIVLNTTSPLGPCHSNDLWSCLARICDRRHSTHSYNPLAKDVYFLSIGTTSTGCSIPIRVIACNQKVGGRRLQKKRLASHPFTKFCWYALTPMRPDFPRRRMYFVLFCTSGLDSITVPLAVLYLPVVFFGPRMRRPDMAVSVNFGYIAFPNGGK